MGGGAQSSSASGFQGFSDASFQCGSTILRKNKKLAFTLAEVLITLGIIGVVAAMTLPTLVAKYKKQETVSKLKKFYSVMSQATERSIADNGPMEDWDGFTTSSNPDEMKAWFDKYLKPYLKITDEEITNFVNEGGGQVGGLLVHFADGSCAGFTNYTGSEGTDQRLNYNGLIHVGYYTTAKAARDQKYKKPCINQFTFLFYDPIKKAYHFTPYFIHSTTSTYNREQFLKQIETIPAYCSALIMYDGWEIKDDYPYKF